jgi:uncharacterized protein
MPDVNTFHEQVKVGNLDEVQKLLDADAGLLNTKNASGQSAVLVAKYYGRSAVLAYLLDRGPALDAFTAAAVGSSDVVFGELDRDGALIGGHSSDGWTLLHMAAFFGHGEMAAWLLERGAEVDARSTNAMKNTPLHAATAGRRTELAKLLLSKGADANARQSGGWTALHGAAQNGDREIVELLLAHGADLTARADNNQTALDLALQSGRQDVAALIGQLSAEAR